MVKEKSEWKEEPTGGEGEKGGREKGRGRRRRTIWKIVVRYV